MTREWEACTAACGFEGVPCDWVDDEGRACMEVHTHYLREPGAIQDAWPVRCSEHVPVAGPAETRERLLAAGAEQLAQTRSVTATETVRRARLTSGALYGQWRDLDAFVAELAGWVDARLTDAQRAELVLLRARLDDLSDGTMTAAAAALMLRTWQRRGRGS